MTNGTENDFLDDPRIEDEKEEQNGVFTQSQDELSKEAWKVLNKK